MKKLLRKIKDVILDFDPIPNKEYSKGIHFAYQHLIESMDDQSEEFLELLIKEHGKNSSVYLGAKKFFQTVQEGIEDFI